MKWYYASLVTALCALSVWGCFGLNHHLILALDAWGNSAPNLTATVGKVNQALDTVNRPCGHGKPCGLLANANKTVIKVGDAIVTTQLQERAITPHTLAAMDSFKTAADRLSGTADAGTDSLKALTATLGTAQTTIQSLQGPIQGLSVSENNFNALLRNSAITRTLDNVAGVTGNMDDTSRDLKKVADRMTTDYLKPVPWWKWPVKRFGEVWDISAAVARHTP